MCPRGLREKGKENQQMLLVYISIVQASEFRTNGNPNTSDSRLRNGHLGELEESCCALASWMRLEFEVIL
jgi:hypothetical protein